MKVRSMQYLYGSVASTMLFIIFVIDIFSSGIFAHPYRPFIKEWFLLFVFGFIGLQALFMVLLSRNIVFKIGPHGITFGRNIENTLHWNDIARIWTDYEIDDEGWPISVKMYYLRIKLNRNVKPGWPYAHYSLFLFATGSRLSDDQIGIIFSALRPNLEEVVREINKYFPVENHMDRPVNAGRS